MHVAFWSPAWPLQKFQNGIITYVHWMKIELEKRGHRVTVFTETAQDTDLCGNVIRVTRSPLERVANRIRRDPRELRVFTYSASISRAIRREHRRNPIDVIEMEESFGWFAEVQRRTSIPVLVKLHGPAFMSLVEEELRTPFARERIEREGAALKRARAIAAPSESTLKDTIGRYGLTPEKSYVVPNPVGTDGFPSWSLARCDRHTILFVGRFDLRKGADIVLRAFLLLAQKNPELKLIFVGPDRGVPSAEGGSLSFAAFRDSLFPVTLRNNIEYMGPLGSREIADLRVRAMVTAVASRWESSGYTLLEAMSQGCPTVSSDAGALRESVVHGVTGRLARANDPADLAFQLSSVLDNPASAEGLGRAAREYVLRKHSPAAVADASLHAYDNLLLQWRKNRK